MLRKERLTQYGVITECDLVETEVVYYDLPRFCTPDLSWKVNLCKIIMLNLLLVLRICVTLQLETKPKKFRCKCNRTY